MGLRLLRFRAIDSRLLLLMAALWVALCAGLGRAACVLKVSETNAHYLTSTATGKPLFIVADTAWRLRNLDRQTIAAHLAIRKAQGFNAIIIQAVGDYRSGILEGRRAPNDYGDYPFEKHAPQGKFDDLSDFARPITTPGADPTSAEQYDFWDHIDYIVSAIKAQGMVAIIAPTAGIAVSGKGTNRSRIVIDTDEIAYGYGNFLGKRLARHNNILWALGFDANPAYPEVSDPFLKDARSRIRAMAEGIADGVNGLTQFDGKADYSTTLMTYHPSWRLRARQPEAEPTGRSSSEWFHDDAWLDFNSLQSFPPYQVRLLADDYAKIPVKPTWLMEPARYEGSVASDGKTVVFTPWVARFQYYQAAFAGALGIGYGRRDTSEPDLTTDWQSNVHSEGTEQIKHLVALMNALGDDGLANRTPDQSLAVGNQGAMRGGTQAALYSDRIQAMRNQERTIAYIYSADGRNITIDTTKLSGPALNAYWMNPRTGRWNVGGVEEAAMMPFMKDVASGATGANVTFNPPGTAGANNDWVLVLSLPTAGIEKSD